MIELSGADALAFLQAQCTADISGMDSGSWRLGGICTPKGRLISLFQAWREGEALRLLLPAELAEPTGAHLRRFVLRSKVVIEIHAGAWSALGIFGAGAARALEAAGLAPPEKPWSRVGPAPSTSLARLPSGATTGPRFVLLAERAAMGAWRGRIEGARDVGSGYWRWSGVDAAVPELSLGTLGIHVPQSLHLEVLGGVSFRKGCYPGQEIVARSQYLGRLRRRMALAHCATAPGGMDVFHDSETREAVGHVVAWGEAPGGGVDLLVECPVALAQEGVLRAGSRDAPALQLRALPYALFDPTE